MFSATIAQEPEAAQTNDLLALPHRLVVIAQLSSLVQVEEVCDHSRRSSALLVSAMFVADCCDSPAALLLSSVVQVEEVCDHSRRSSALLLYAMFVAD